VTQINYKAFYKCSNLETVTLPANLKSIGSYAFTHCEKLTEVTIPDKTDYLAYGAFAYCTNLTKVTIPKSVTDIWYSFEDCSDDLVIWGYEDSYAEEYAEDFDIAFETIDS
jgi:hypothetical protein